MNLKLLILLVLAISVAISAPRRSDLTENDGYLPIHRHAYRLPASLDEDSLHQYDVIRLTAELQFDLDNAELRGVASLELSADEIQLSRVDLRLTQSLDIDSVWSDSVSVDSFAREGEDSLQIYFSPVLELSDTAIFHIAYGGSPETVDAWGGIRFAQESGWRPQICYTMGDGLNTEPPPANYTWLPSYADPTDKVLWEAILTADDDLVATTGGSLIDSTHNDSTISWHYRLDQPISTYLIFVSISDYEIMVQRESDPLIANYVYPSRVTQAETHFSNVPAVLDGFVELFGDYPFDRFGYNMTRIGDMEHATCVSHLDQLVGANHTYDGLLFHELSHMWWGDWVTIGDWRDLWLNEGFASYCEALGMEIIGGDEAYDAYVENDLMRPARTSPIFPIYDPNDYWSSTVYEKGGCVLHMLRGVMGDSTFFAAMREYGQQFAFANAVTTDFQAACESHYGESLQWFFDQWIYEGTRFPQYVVDYSIEFDWWRLLITQQQAGDWQFTMPMEVAFYSGQQLQQIDTLFVTPDYVYYPEENSYDSVAIDPNNWILKRVEYLPINSSEERNTGVPAEFEINAVFPNPFNPAATIEYTLSRTSPVEFTVYNLQGQEVHHHNYTSMLPGSHQLSWDGAAHASGIYIFALTAQGATQTAKAVLLK